MTTARRILLLSLFALPCACGRKTPPAQEQQADNAATRYADTLKNDLDKAQKAAAVYEAAGKASEQQAQAAGQ
ncbi:MAG: hypothetical protein WCU88_08570 [Elusimicrobiota bacterium]|jgi:hypothetical protein